MTEETIINFVKAFLRKPEHLHNIGTIFCYCTVFYWTQPMLSIQTVEKLYKHINGSEYLTILKHDQET